MKTSILVIAHNEEKNIGSCLDSLMKQTQKADEVIVIVHNSTDKTLEIVKTFKDVQGVEYEGPRGHVYALLKGFNTVSNEIILCIDGDSEAANNWVEEMSKVLQYENTLLAGSWVKYTGTALGALLTLKHKNIKKGTNEAYRIWGPSFAFNRKDLEKIKNLTEESIEMRKKLNIDRYCDDYWRAINLRKIGNIRYTNKTYVKQKTKESTSLEVMRRHRENSKDVILINNYFASLS